MHVLSLSCFACGTVYPAGRLVNLCSCGKPLRVDYDLAAAARTLSPDALAIRPHGGMWRYREVLPLPEGAELPTLGEGMTPLVPLADPGAFPGVKVWVKDESVNPTGSFKARGMAAAVAMAKHLGAAKLAVPSAGNAGGALAAYAANLGLEAHVFMPKDVPMANRLECEVSGAKVVLVDGLITDCAKEVQQRKESEGWFDMSTLKEPYRVEGKKTMGYEIAEQFNWDLPDVILYPTGGGTGLIGMAKAFDEMQAMGWIGAKRPRFYAVQAEGCAPLAPAFLSGATSAEEVKGAHTIAAGLRVPRAIGDFIMLDILRKTGGGAPTVSDAELMRGAYDLGAASGVAACPEGGACFAALKSLVGHGDVKGGDRVVLFNTGSGSKYSEAFSAIPRPKR